MQVNKKEEAKYHTFTISRLGPSFLIFLKISNASFLFLQRAFELYFVNIYKASTVSSLEISKPCCNASCSFCLRVSSWIRSSPLNRSLWLRLFHIDVSTAVFANSGVSWSSTWKPPRPLLSVSFFALLPWQEPIMTSEGCLRTTSRDARQKRILKGEVLEASMCLIRKHQS